jgi:hypothetical protein
VAEVAPPAGAAPPPRCAHAPIPEGTALEAAVLPALSALGAERAALFWCEGSPFVGACALVAPELPDGVCFARLLSDPAPPPPLEGAS